MQVQRRTQSHKSCTFKGLKTVEINISQACLDIHAETMQDKLN
jgi:hypothetical protein